MPLKLVSLIGLFVILGLAWLMSSHRRKVDWRLVILGVGLQLTLAALFFNSQRWTFDREFTSLESVVVACESGSFAADRFDIQATTPENKRVTLAEGLSLLKKKEVTREQLMGYRWQGAPSQDEPVTVARYQNGIVFAGIKSFFDTINSCVRAGSSFVFNINGEGEFAIPRNSIMATFAFGILPTVIFFAALMAVLYHLGIMQLLVRAMAFVMQKTLRTSPAESLAAAANVLVGHTEAPLVVKPYIPTMTRSELNALMVGGFATISGSLLAIFAGMNVSAGHLLTASLISAPAALVLAKIMQPETEEVTSLAVAEKNIEGAATNVIEAAANGAADGLKLALNIGAMLIAFLALIKLADMTLQGIGGWFGWEISIALIFGYVFYPLAFILGITPDDCLQAGNLLGEKMVVNEFIAYDTMSKIESQVGSVDAERITQRTRVILTYALCGFSNFGAIGIQLGGIGPLAPDRKGDLAQLGLRAMFGGMLAACMTACIAGLLYGVLN